MSRLGITGFQTTFGTSSLIELTKLFGGSLTNVDPALVELKKVLPKIAAVGLPAAMPGLFQQGQCDVMYTNTQTVATLKGKGVDVEFVKPESGAITFFTTMHIAKGTGELENAYKYLDLVIGKEAQEALTKPPYNFLPVNKDVPLAADMPMKSLDEMAEVRAARLGEDQPAARRLDREVQQGNGEVICACALSSFADPRRGGVQLRGIGGVMSVSTALMTPPALRATSPAALGRHAALAEWQLALPLALAFAALFLAPLLLLVATSFFNDDKITQPGFAQLGQVLRRSLQLQGHRRHAAARAEDGLRHRRRSATRWRWSTGPARRACRRCCCSSSCMPMLLSVVVRTFAWIVVLGREGVVNQTLLWLGVISEPLRLLQTELGLVISLTQIEMPLMLLPLISVMSRLDPNLRDASAALGASRWRTLFTVIVPLSMPGLVAGCLLVFASSTTAFISQTVIGGVRLIYLPLVIWQQSLVVYNWPLAAVASLSLVVSVLSVIAALS